MRIHLVTIVGAHVEVLPFMLDHYRAQGIDSFRINVHQKDADDPIVDAVRAVTTPRGCEIASVFVGDWQSQQEGVWRASMRVRPNDWCVLADQDELHVYPDRLASILAYCDRKGYDYITGAFIDRVSADGGFPAVDRSRPLGPQFPLGGVVSYPMLGADPRKVVAAKGFVTVVRGQHLALTGVGCPIEESFTQVHHFKWTAGLVDRLRDRAALLRRNEVQHWTESDRFVQYFTTHGGRIDCADPRFLLGSCEPSYPHWDRIRSLALAHRAAAAASR